MRHSDEVKVNFLGDGEKWLNIICADPVSRWTCIVMERYATWQLFHSWISAVASDLFQESEHLGSINLTPRDFLDGWLIRRWGRSLFFCFFHSNQQKSRQSISCLKPCFTGNRLQCFCFYMALYLFPANVLHYSFFFFFYSIFRFAICCPPKLDRPALCVYLDYLCQVFLQTFLLPVFSEQLLDVLSS